LSQTALADILTVGPGGLDVVNRKRLGQRQPMEIALERQKSRPAPEIPSPRAGRPAEDLDVDSEPSGVEDGIEGGVEGGVPGGVVGGVAGGVAGGTVGGVPSAAVAQPVEVPEVMAVPA